MSIGNGGVAAKKIISVVYTLHYNPRLAFLFCVLRFQKDGLDINDDV